MVLVGLAVPNGKSAQVPQTSLVGTWRLLSRTDREGGHVMPADGPLGADAVGLLGYGAHHVSAQLMARRRDSAATNAPSPPTVPDPNNSAATGGYDAYFGRYE